MIKGRRGKKQRAATRIEGIGVKAEKKKKITILQLIATPQKEKYVDNAFKGGQKKIKDS